MKRVLPCCLLVFAVAGLMADMPGNQPREQVTVHVHLSNLQGFTIYSSDDYSSAYSSTEVRDSSQYILQGGFGAPPCITFFGIDNNEKHTDSMTICNEEQGTVFLKLSVENGKLVSSQSEVKQESLPTVTGNNDSQNTSFFLRNQIRLLVLVALASVVLLVGGYFIMQRRKQTV